MVAMPKPYLTLVPPRQPVTKSNRPYRAIGGALQAWRSGYREVLLCGPAGTGKSRLALQKFHFCAQKYPGARLLICRKTRHSLSQTALVTYEQKVLPEGWLDRYVHFNTVDQQYEYVNGSIIGVGGLDKPSKIMSSEWDMIYPQEAIELFEDDWQSLATRLRNNVMPYQQLLGDTNPGPPTHWLKRRCDRGITRLIESRHEDNPSVTDAYLAILRGLTGVLYQRLYLGRWAAAEGIVYHEWDRAVHIARHSHLVSLGVLHADGSVNRLVIRRVFGAVDWGYANAGVLHVYGADGDGRLYLLREIYRSQRTIDWWIEQAQNVHREFGGIETFACDPSEPGYIMQFCGAGLPAIAATNDISPGVDAVKRRLRITGDGRPRFSVYEYALQERDSVLEAKHKPCCFEEEIDAYVWPQEKEGQPLKEKPVDDCNHAMDTMRYGTMYYDGAGIGFEEVSGTYDSHLDQYLGYAS